MATGYQDTYLGGGGGGGEFTDDLFGVGRITGGQVAAAERAGVPYARAAAAHGPILDIASLISGGAAGAGRLGEAANAARAGELGLTSRAAAALDRSGALGRYAERITAPREITTPEGYGFLLNQGRTPLM